MLQRAAIIFFAIVQLLSPAKAGIDDTYVRPGKGWGTEIFEKAFGQEVFGKSYAVIVGVGQYDSFEKLDAPSSDALRMRDFLRDEAGFDFIVTLTDEKATKERIETLMEDFLPRVINPGDRFLFYFSGHGATRVLARTKRGYLVLKKSVPDDWGSMIDMPRVKEWAENVDMARHVLFLLDSCFSGLTMIQVKSANATSKTLERLEQPAHHLVTAGVETEESYTYNGASIFTDEFLKAARGQYSDGLNGVISLSEIMNDINRGIDQRGADLGGTIKMTPHMYETRLEDNAGEFFFLVGPVAKRPTPEPTKPDVTAKSAASEITPSPDITPPSGLPGKPRWPTQRPLRASDNYVFALVPKNTNNPFFDQALAGCKKAEKELKGAAKCLYIGPGEYGGGDEEAQIVADLIAKKIDGIAVSPADAPAMANALRGAIEAQIPVLTWDSDLLPKDNALRLTYVGTRNYDIGVNLAKLVMKIKPRGGTVCIQSGAAAATNHNERVQGIRDTLSGQKSAAAPGVRLTGQSGWTEIAGCPLYTNDDFSIANQQMEDILNKYPDLDAFVPTGGFPQFLPDVYEKTAMKYKDKIASGALALVVADTLPIQIELMKKGLSSGQVGQRPFEMGYKAMYFLKDIRDGKALPGDPTYTGLDICTPRTADTCISGGG
jgi:ribose transport system substrate-binding protein